MNPNQYRAALKRLGLSQGAAARFFDVNPVTARRWATGDTIPRTVSLVLRIMVANHWTVAQIEEWLKALDA